jgi:MSHA biogenesis protein MshN
MLQELDRRNATAGSDGEQPPAQVKPVAPPHQGREWFWRVIAVLMLLAICWVGWVAFQLQPRRPLATEEAFKAAEQARKGPIVSVTATPPAPAPASAAPQAAPPPAETPKPQTRGPQETLKLAQVIETPIPERSAPAPTPPPAVAEPKAAPSAAPAAPQAPAAAPQPAGKVVVSKRERARPGSEAAEAHFRRAAALLNQGRVSEAEDHLIGALQADPAHIAARQAYVALLLEQQRVDAAKRVLTEALAGNPGQATFALTLARILAEQRDYLGAIDVMDRAGSISKNADFQSVRGAVLQRLGRHPEAVEAYQAAVQGAAQPATTWVGLGISLEAVGRKAEAAHAYRRSLGGGLTREVRDYAESRVRALE